MPRVSRLRAVNVTIIVAVLMASVFTGCSPNDDDVESQLSISATSKSLETSPVPRPASVSTVELPDSSDIANNVTATADTDSPPTAEATSKPTPAPSATPLSSIAPLFGGYDFEFEEGDFWRFRWEWTDTSCAQGSGCRTTEEDGVYQVTLGTKWSIQGKTMYRIVSNGDDGYEDGSTIRKFSPRWNYIGIENGQIFVSEERGTGAILRTLFDARADRWAGSGFFTERFDEDDLLAARSGHLTSSHQFASWQGVEIGPWQSVGAAASGGECSTFDGRILCPSEEKFDYSETEYYRSGIGPFGYTFSYSASFSGGGFTSSFQTNERVALIASSFAGDDPGLLIPEPTATLSPSFDMSTPTAIPTPVPIVLGDPIYGPVDGELVLAVNASEIPEFESGVLLNAGVTDAIFENPSVSGKWSHGIVFRNSADETFHAVFINSDGEWGHFARGGSLESQTTIALGEFDFDRSTGAENRLTVWFGVVDGLDRGLLQINDEDVAVLDLSFAGASDRGDVGVMSGLFPADEFNGSITKYRNFTVYKKP